MPLPPNPDISIKAEVRLPESLWAKINDHRFANRLPSKAAAFRDLIEAGLAANESKVAMARMDEDRV